MQLSVFDILFLLGSAQGFFIAFLLYRQEVSNLMAARYLLALIVLVSILLLAKLSFQPKWLLEYPEIILLPDVILFTIGPCIWLFVRHLVLLPPLSKQQWWWHASPAIFYSTVINILLGQHLSRRWSFLTDQDIITSFYMIEGVGILSLSIYFIKSLRLVSHRQRQPDRGEINPAAARFLPTFFTIGLGLTVIWACSFIFHILNFDPQYQAYQIFWLLLVGYVYWLAYRVVLQQEIFELPSNPTPPTLVDPSLVHRIQTFLEQEQPFLEPSLKLGDLAEQLDMPRHELSRIINQGFGQSFFDLINSYRIRTFIERREAKQAGEQSILQLAYEVGFNSKSAFNRAFRKAKGASPSQFFKQHSPS